jgi:hypothetical protein
MAYPHGKKTYGELDLQERWEWHSSNYAFRHVMLDAPIEAGTCPTDPRGEFFDRVMVDRAVTALRSKRSRMRNQGRAPTAKPDADVLEGRAIANAYARSKGFADFDTAYAAGGAISYADVVASILAAGGVRRMPGSGEPSTYDLTNLQKDLGVSAKEYAPNAAEMAAGRAALGIREPEPPPREEATANA